MYRYIVVYSMSERNLLYCPVFSEPLFEVPFLRILKKNFITVVVIHYSIYPLVKISSLISSFVKFICFQNVIVSNLLKKQPLFWSASKNPCPLLKIFLYSLSCERSVSSSNSKFQFWSIH